MTDTTYLRGTPRSAGASWRASAGAVLLALVSAVAMAVVGCGDDGAEDAAVENCPPVEAPMATPGGPPALPYIFTGTLYVDGDPAPEGVRVWVQMVQSWSAPTLTGPDGSFRNLIHGPVHAADFGTPFYFCVGERDGNSVKADLTVDYEDKGGFHEVDGLRVEVPYVP